MRHSLQACLIVPHFPIQVATRRLVVDRSVPMVVANGTSDRATVVDLCPYAAQLGIHPGMLVYMARRQCGALQVVIHDPTLVAEEATRVATVLAQHSDTIRQDKPGRWILPLWGLGSGFSDAHAIAARLREEVTAETGFHCVLGLAAQAGVARIAADVARDQNSGCIVVLPGAEAAFLASLPVAVLPGIGTQTETALLRLGITTAGQLADMPIAMLTQLCGARGPSLARAAAGLPVTREAGPQTITCSWQSRKEPERGSRQLHAQVYSLTEQVGQALRAEGTAAGTIAVDVTWTDGVQRRGTTCWPRRRDLDRDLASGSRVALDVLLPLRRLAIVSVSVSASNLGPIQRDLLDGDDGRERQLQRALDGIKRRYGMRAILPGSFYGTPGAPAHMRP